MPLKEKKPHDKDPIVKGIKEPMVIFPLRQYETLMEHLEEVEDRLALMERANEPTISQEEVEEMWADNTVELISEKAVDYRARKHGKGPKMNKVLAMNVKEKIEKELARLSNHELIILHEIIRSIRSVKKTKRSAIALKAPYLRVREALKDSGNLSEDILAERTEAL